MMDLSDNETETTTSNNQLNTSESEDEAWDEEDNLPFSHFEKFTWRKGYFYSKPLLAADKVP